jgi:hypothetical protein
MSYKEIIKSKLNKFPNISYIDKVDLPFNYDLSSEDDLIGTKINEENLNDKLISDYKTIKEDEDRTEKNNNNDTISNEYKISNFYFDLISKKNPENLKLNHNNTKDKNNLNGNKESKKRGRKRKRSDINESDKKEKNKDSNTHDRYSDDNMRKKCKNIILKFALEFLNKKIKEQYDNNIGRGKLRKELKILNQDEKVNSTVNIEKSFLFKTLKDIFSENISARLSNFPKNHNKILIESLIEEKDEEKKQYFIKLFNITFLDCLKYFRGEETGIGELEGFKTISSIKETLIEEQGEEYFDLFMYYMKNFKDIIESKKARKKKKLKIKIQKNY